MHTAQSVENADRRLCRKARKCTLYKDSFFVLLMDLKCFSSFSALCTNVYILAQLIGHPFLTCVSHTAHVITDDSMSSICQAADQLPLPC